MSRAQKLAIAELMRRVSRPRGPVEEKEVNDAIALLEAGS